MLKAVILKKYQKGIIGKSYPMRDNQKRIKNKEDKFKSVINYNFKLCVIVC